MRRIYAVRIKNKLPFRLRHLSDPLEGQVMGQSVKFMKVRLLVLEERRRVVSLP